MKNKKVRKRYSSNTGLHRLHRFFVCSQNIEKGRVVLGEEHAHQIRDVLRLTAGEHIIVLDNKGAEFETALAKVGRNEVKGQVLRKRRATGEPDTRITLYQSVGRQDKFEWVLQKCTEIGVVRFVPVIAHRSVVRDCDAIKASRLRRWRRIITEAAEQSHRGRIPQLRETIKFEQGMAELEGFDRSLIASTQAKTISLRSCLRGRSDAGGANIALLVGPEGGFTEDEVKRSQAGGAIPFALGPRILRTETAAVVASSLILYELGELAGVDTPCST